MKRAANSALAAWTVSGFLPACWPPFSFAHVMLEYCEAKGFFPRAAIQDRNGCPGLSWRVAILPYLEEEQLYKTFRLDEPWDSPHNITLLGHMPKVYAHPADATSAAKGLTYFRVFTGPGTVFDPNVQVRLSGIPDGPSNTLLVVEAADPVPWTKPDELSYAPEQPLPRLGGKFHVGFLAVTGSGWQLCIPHDTSEQTIRAAITRDGGETVDFLHLLK